MKRRKFFELFGLGVATAVVAPGIVTEVVKAPKEVIIKETIGIEGGLMTQGFAASDVLRIYKSTGNLLYNKSIL